MTATATQHVTPQQAREDMIRRLFALVLDRSFGTTNIGLRLRRDLELKGREEDEISYRIERVLGVHIAPVEWSSFVTIGDVVRFVELETQRRIAEETE